MTNPTEDNTETLAEVLADRDHWKAHAEEAGQGFSQVCRDYARVSAQLVVLRERVVALAHSPETDQYRDEACRHAVEQPYANNRYVRLLDDLRAILTETAP